MQPMIRMEPERRLRPRSRGNSLFLGKEGSEVDVYAVIPNGSRPSVGSLALANPEAHIAAIKKTFVSAVLLLRNISKITNPVVSFNAVDVIDKPARPMAVVYGPRDTMGHVLSVEDVPAQIALPVVCNEGWFSSVFAVPKCGADRPWLPNKKASFWVVIQQLTKMFWSERFFGSHVMTPHHVVRVGPSRQRSAQPAHPSISAKIFKKIAVNGQQAMFGILDLYAVSGSIRLQLLGIQAAEKARQSQGSE